MYPIVLNPIENATPTGNMNILSVLPSSLINTPLLADYIRDAFVRLEGIQLIVYGLATLGVKIRYSPPIGKNSLILYADTNSLYFKSGINISDNYSDMFKIIGNNGNLVPCPFSIDHAPILTENVFIDADIPSGKFIVIINYNSDTFNINFGSIPANNRKIYAGASIVYIDNNFTVPTGKTLYIFKIHNVYGVVKNLTISFGGSEILNENIPPYTNIINGYNLQLLEGTEIISTGVGVYGYLV